MSAIPRHRIRNRAGDSPVARSEQNLPFNSLLRRIADKHVTPQCRQPKESVHPVGRKRRLTDDQVREVRALHASGMTYKALAERFSVKVGMIISICDGITGAHVI